MFIKSYNYKLESVNKNFKSKKTNFIKSTIKI